MLYFLVVLVVFSGLSCANIDQFVINEGEFPVLKRVDANTAILLWTEDVVSEAGTLYARVIDFSIEPPLFGDPILVHNQPVHAFRYSYDVAAIAGGTRFVVIWSDPQVDYLDVHYKVFDLSGAVIRNANLAFQFTGGPRGQSVTATPGGFVIVGSTSSATYARDFDNDGNPTSGTPVTVRTDSQPLFRNPKALGLQSVSGTSLFASIETKATSSSDIEGAIFHIDGGTVTTIQSWTVLHPGDVQGQESQGDLVIDTLEESSGLRVLFYHDRRDIFSVNDVTAAIVIINSTSIDFPAEEFRLGECGAGDCFPAGAAIDGQKVVAVWQTEAPPKYSIKGRLADLDGQLLGFQFSINTDTDRDHSIPNIISLSNERLFIVWGAGNMTNTNREILGKLYNNRIVSSALPDWIYFTEDNPQPVSDVNITSPVFGAFTVLLTLENPLTGSFSSPMIGDAAVNWTASNISLQEVHQLFADLVFHPAENFEGNTTLNVFLSVDVSSSVLAHSISLIGIPVNDLPELINNQLNITEKQTVILNEINLLAIDVETPAEELLFLVSDVSNGYFSRKDSDEPIFNFTMSEILQRSIYFTSENGDPPSYWVAVSDGYNQTEPARATVNFTPMEGISLPALLLGIIIGILIFSLGVVIVLHILYRWRKRARENFEFAEVEMSTMGSANRLSKGYTIIGGKYELINKISVKDAQDLEEQAGITIHFPNNKKVSVVLGEGHYGKLRLARNLQTKQFAAVKKIKGAENIKQSMNEASIQKLLNDLPHILPLWDAIESVGHDGNPVIYHFMPLAGFGSGETLRTALVAETDPKVHEGILTEVARGLLKGLSAMHKKNIYHFDMKPNNFIIDHKGIAYVIDFGCSLQLPEGQENVTQGIEVNGDTRYFCPQRLAYFRHCYNFKGDKEKLPYFNAAYSDAWSAGLALLECAIHKYPLKTMRMEDRLRLFSAQAAAAYLNNIPELAEAKQDSIFAAIKELLNCDPSKHIGLDAVLDMPVFHKKFFESSEEYQKHLKKLKLQAVTAETSKGVTTHIYSRNSTIFKGMTNDPNYTKPHDPEEEEEESKNQTKDDEYKQTPSTKKRKPNLRATYLQTPAEQERERGRADSDGLYIRSPMKEDERASEVEPSDSSYQDDDYL